MGLIEIGLAIWAWKRGWRGWALLPMGIGMLVAFLLGSLCSTDAEFDRLSGVFIFIDLAVIVSLIVMVVLKRRNQVLSTGARAVEVVTAGDNLGTSKALPGSAPIAKAD